MADSQARTRTRSCSKSPIKQPSPVKRLSKSPVQRSSKSPAKRLSKSPAKRLSKSPVKRLSKSPIKQPSKSPAKRLSKSPIKQPSKSPAKSQTDLQIEDSDDNIASLKRKRELTKNELNSLEYAQKSKTITQQSSTFRCYFPLVKTRPAYLLRDALAKHDLNNALKLFILITKDTRSCPFQLTKTGGLLLRKFMQLEPEHMDELGDEMLSFFRTYKGVHGTPVIELYLDFFNFWLENRDHQFLIEQLNFKHHIRSSNLNNKHMILYLNMLQSFINFKRFFNVFKNEGALDYKQFTKDDIKKNDYDGICLQLKNITIGYDSDEDHPLDYLLLNLIDMLMLAERFDEAKQSLLKYYEQYPTNLNAVIYILKFNEYYLKDEEIFKKFYNILLKLDGSNKLVIFYLEKIVLVVERLKVMMNYVDHTKNKEDYHVWKMIYEDLRRIGTGSIAEQEIKRHYKLVFASYWSTYHFTTLSVKINQESCDLIFYKAFTFYYFQSSESFLYLSKILTILSFAKSDKFQALKDLIVK